MTALHAKAASLKSKNLLVGICLIGIFCLSGLLCGCGEQDGPKSVRLPSQKPAAVSSEAGSGDLYALVVGISTYRHNKIPKLKLADKDARDFAAFLKTQDKLFRNIDISLLVNEEATEREIRKYLDYKLSRATRDDTVMVFFSGHGATDPRMPGDSFFVAYDAEPDFLASTAVNLSQSKFLKRLAAKRAVLFADTCHAGGFSDVGTKTIESPTAALAKQIKESEGKVLLASSRDDEVSVEKPELPNGVFTHYLLQGLKGEAAGKDGIVTLNDLYNYVHKKTVQETGGIQHPRMVGDLEGPFPLALTRAHEVASSVVTPTKPVESTTSKAAQDYKEKLEREKRERDEEIAKLRETQRLAAFEKERLEREKREMQGEIEKRKVYERDRVAKLNDESFPKLPPLPHPAPGYSRYIDAERRFSFDYPTTMKVQTEGIDEVKVGHSDIALRITALVLRRSSSTIPSNEAILDSFKRKLKEQLNDVSILEEGKLAHLPGTQGYVICAFKDQRGVGIVQLVQYYLAESLSLQIIISDRPEAFKKDEKAIRQVHQSLRILNAKLE